MIVKTLQQLRAAAHRRLAISALRDGGMPSRRFARYKHHMAKARALEVRYG